MERQRRRNKIRLNKKSNRGIRRKYSFFTFTVNTFHQNGLLKAQIYTKKTIDL